MVTVRISDDGPGLPKAVRGKLFRPLGNCKVNCGGLGISIARELAERNGATLRLGESKKGTAFVLELPGVRSIALDSGAAMPSLGLGHRLGWQARRTSSSSTSSTSSRLACSQTIRPAPLHAPPALFVHRQPQRRQQRLRFLLGHHVRMARTLAERVLPISNAVSPRGNNSR